MSRCFVALVVVMTLSACTPADTQTTTTLASTTTSSTLPTTTTTTTPTSTTTSTTLLEGNWAEFPLVVIWEMALGWWDGTEWVQVDQRTSLPVSGGEDYQVAKLGGGDVIQGGAPENSGCAQVLPEGLPGVSFSDDSALVTTIEHGLDGHNLVSGVAISAPWELTPRPVVDGEAHPDLEQEAIEILAARGFAKDSVEIVQTIDADLDGDGAIETLVVVEETELGNEMSDVYSMVFVVSPEWQDSRVVEASVIPADEVGFPATFRISAVADLSGDGVMEVVLDGGAWENFWVSVYELTDEGFVNRIEAGCGV